MKQDGGADYIMAFKARIFYFSRKYIYLLFLLIIYLYGYIEFQLKVIMDEKVCRVKHGETWDVNKSFSSDRLINGTKP